jgi:NAD(P)-dependent dehydrogenase (short-subunit alcohol dehydrogenase family)
LALLVDLGQSTERVSRWVVEVGQRRLGFAVNYLAAFAITNDLLPLLEAAAPARVVNVASLGQLPIDFDDLHLEHG